MAVSCSPGCSFCRGAFSLACLAFRFVSARYYYVFIGGYNSCFVAGTGISFCASVQHESLDKLVAPLLI